MTKSVRLSVCRSVGRPVSLSVKVIIGHDMIISLKAGKLYFYIRKLVPNSSALPSLIFAMLSIAGTSLTSIPYRVSTNFRLELRKPSAREFEGQQFFFSSDAVSSLTRFEFSSPLLTLFS